MKIKVLYEDDIKRGYANCTTIEVPDDDYTVLIDIDYEQRLSEAKPEKRKEVKRFETLQEVFDEMNKKEYNAHRRFYRNKGEAKAPFKKDGESENEIDPIEYIPDNSQEQERNRNYEYEVLCDKLRQALKAEYAEALIAVVLDEKTPEEYAAEINVGKEAMYKRLQRAKKKCKELFSKCPK